MGLSAVALYSPIPLLAVLYKTKVRKRPALNNGKHHANVRTKSTQTTTGPSCSRPLYIYSESNETQYVQLWY